MKIGILLPSYDNVNSYVSHIYRKYKDLDRNNKTCLPGCKEVA